MPKRSKKIAPKILTQEIDSPFTLSLHMGQEVYESTGATAFEALRNLKRPMKLFLKGLLVIKQGDKKRELHLPPMNVRKLFFKAAHLGIAKNLEIGMH